MAPVTRQPQARQDHDGHEDNGQHGAARQDPAHAFDFGLGVAVEGDGDFIIEFLDLWEQISKRGEIGERLNRGTRRRLGGVGQGLRHSPYSAAPSAHPSFGH